MLRSFWDLRAKARMRFSLPGRGWGVDQWKPEGAAVRRAARWLWVVRMAIHPSGATRWTAELDGLLHLFNGAERDALELSAEGFGAAGVDLRRDAGDANRFLKEGGLFALGFGQGHGDLRAADGDGDAGEACAGAKVEECGDAGGEGLGTGDGFDEMASEDGLRVPDGGEIGAGIPAKNQRKIVVKLFRL